MPSLDDDSIHILQINFNERLVRLIGNRLAEQSIQTGELILVLAESQMNQFPVIRKQRKAVDSIGMYFRYVSGGGKSIPLLHSRDEIERFHQEIMVDATSGIDAHEHRQLDAVRDSVLLEYVAVAVDKIECIVLP